MVSFLLPIPVDRLIDLIGRYHHMLRTHHATIMMERQLTGRHAARTNYSFMKENQRSASWLWGSLYMLI
jgi:hypothetical protein